MSNLVMYLRLSLEDDVNADESNSITNQRRIIRDYISSHEDLRSMTVTEKCDDGYSGTNMNRPGMQELLAMVKEQRVDCIIVKDMSRFARNYLETGKYIEQIFPFMGIRFIAINDNYDSKKVSVKDKYCSNKCILFNAQEFPNKTKIRAYKTINGKSVYGPYMTINLNSAKEKGNLYYDEYESLCGKQF